MDATKMYVFFSFWDNILWFLWIKLSKPEAIILKKWRRDAASYTVFNVYVKQLIYLNFHRPVYKEYGLLSMWQFTYLAMKNNALQTKRNITWFSKPITFDIWMVRSLVKAWFFYHLYVDICIELPSWKAFCCWKMAYGLMLDVTHTYFPYVHNILHLQMCVKFFQDGVLLISSSVL